MGALTLVALALAPVALSVPVPLTAALVVAGALAAVALALLTGGACLAGVLLAAGPVLALDAGLGRGLGRRLGRRLDTASPRPSASRSPRLSRDGVDAPAFPADPPLWADLMASTSWAFFMELVPEIPMPAAIDFRSASSMELSPPARFLEPAVDGADSGAPGVDSMVSVT